MTIQKFLFGQFRTTLTCLFPDAAVTVCYRGEAQICFFVTVVFPLLPLSLVHFSVEQQSPKHLSRSSQLISSYLTSLWLLWFSIPLHQQRSIRCSLPPPFATFNFWRVFLILFSFQSSSLYFPIFPFPIMLTLMTSATCAGFCFTMGVSVTHPYMPYLLLFICLPRKSVTSPMHNCSTQPGFNSLHALLLGIIFDLLVFFTNAYFYLQIFPVLLQSLSMTTI